MDAKLKAKWVKALRSRKYKQGREYLYNSKTNSYCCLGVLGVLIGKPLGEMDMDFNAPQWGLFSHDIELKLAQEMNDLGDSFKTIAAWVEKNL